MKQKRWKGGREKHQSSKKQKDEQRIMGQKEVITRGEVEGKGRQERNLEKGKQQNIKIKRACDRKGQQRYRNTEVALDGGCGWRSSWAQRVAAQRLPSLNPPWHTHSPSLLPFLLPHSLSQECDFQFTLKCQLSTATQPEKLHAPPLV